MGAKLDCAFNCTWSMLLRWVSLWLCSFEPLAVTFSGYHSGCHLICCIDWTVMLNSSLLWGICSSLDSGLLASTVEVSKSCHNSTIKLLIQNPPISLQDNTVLSLHCKFQALIFSDRGENANSYLAEWLTYSLTHLLTNTRRLQYASGAPPTEA